MFNRVQQALSGIALLAGAASALAQPATINLHGAVASPEGTPLTGSRAYFVQFYDAASGGNALGAAYTGNVTVSPSGVFNLPLTPPPGIFTATEVWYELGIDTDEPVDNNAADDVFNGRIQVQSVPFALQAAEAGHVALENVGDGTIDQTELSALEGITSSIQAQFDLLDSSTSGFDTAISALEASQATQDTTIAAKADASAVYTKAEMDTQQATQDTAIDALETSQGTQDTAIDALETSQAAQDTTIAAKADASAVYTKAEMDGQQATQDTAIDALETSQATQDTAIDALETSQATQDTAIDALETSQASQDTTIAAKADASAVYTKAEMDGQQATQDTAIGALETSQATQDTAIDALETSQATQDTVIGALETSQATQDTAIAAKADASVVYTKTESDANFVAVVGDTMTGALAISDTTASTSAITGALTVAGGAGVSGDLNVGGEASADALSIVSAGAPPGVTTDKLYNVGGALFFDGTELNAGGSLGSSIESSEITDGTIATADIADGAITSAKIGIFEVANANIAANAITTSKVANGTITNAKMFDNAVTSIKIQNDEIVDADINSAANISTSKLNANVVVSGEGNAQLTNDAGYLTAEADTLTAVTGRGATTATQITLNGGVRTDSVSEVTAANGVSVDGVKLKDSFVELSSISAPSPTTNRLYNEGGTLKFNGTALGGGGTQYTFINWHYTVFTTAIMANRDVFTAIMPMAGTITAVQVYCRQDSSVAGSWDVRVNGTSVFGGAQDASTSFDDDVRKSVTVTNGGFSAGATLSLWGNLTSGQVNQPMVFITISY